MILGIEGERLEEMVRFFLLALCVVAPLTFISVRRSQNTAAAEKAATAEGGDKGADAPEPADPADLATTIAAIDAAAPTATSPTDIDVAMQPTVNGSVAPEQLVRSLINDAATRRGMTWEWLTPTSNGTPPTTRTIRLTVVER